MGKNERGSVYVLGIFLCGLLLFVCAYFYFIFQGVKVYSEKSYTCREGLLEVQGFMAKAANDLEKMNSRAQKLQTELLRAEKAVLQAPSPHLKAVALAWVAKVKAQQGIFRAKQLSILSEAKIQAEARLMRLKNKMGISFTHPSSIPFAFQEIPKGSLSPMYVPEFFIEKKQKIRLAWQEQVNANKKISTIRSWLQVPSGPSAISLHKDCSVSLKKEGKWYADLTAGKSFLNF